MGDIDYVQLTADYKSYVENRIYVKLASIASRFEDHTGGTLNELILIFTDLNEPKLKTFKMEKIKTEKLTEKYSKYINS